MKKQVFTLLLMFVNLFLNVEDVKAVHFAGGEITYVNVGQDSFMVSYTAYRDCNGINMATAQMLVECKTTSQRLQTVSIPKPTPVDITPICNQSCTRCQSSACSFQYGFEKYVYTKLVILHNAGSCCEIALIITGCCRSNSITTGPDNESYRVEAFLNRCIAPRNNSVQFEKKPEFFSSVGHDFTIDPGIYDPDNVTNKVDSIVCELDTPMATNGSGLQYSGSFAYNKPLQFWGFPNYNLPSPRGFQLNRTTGILSFRPMSTDVTIIALKVSEYRYGQKISEVTRDIMHIALSNTNSTPYLTSTTYSGASICYNDTFKISLTGNDYDTIQFLTLDWDSTLPGAIYTYDTSDKKHPVLSIEWATTKKDLSKKDFIQKVTVRDNACPLNGFYTYAFPVHVKEHTNLQLTHNKKTCNYYDLSAIDMNHSNSAVRIKGGNGIFKFNFNSLGTRQIFLPDSGVYIFELKPENPVCGTSVFDTIDVKNYQVEVEMPADTTICEGDLIKLTPVITNQHGPISLDWSTGQKDSLEITVGPLHQKTTVTLQVKDQYNCIITDETEIDIIPVPELDLGKDKLVCPGTQVTLSNLKNQTGTSYEWYKLYQSNIISTSNSISVNEEGVYICKAINSGYLCNTSDTIKIKNYSINIPTYDVICGGDYYFPNVNGAQFVSWNGVGVKKATTYQYYIDQDIANLEHNSTYNYFYSIEDSVGCWHNDTMNLRFIENIKIDKQNVKQVYCTNGDPQILYGGTPKEGWWFGEGVTNIPQQFDPGLVDSGKYKLFYRRGGYCSGKDSIEVLVLEAPVVEFDADKRSGQLPLQVQFTSSVLYVPDSLASYRWLFGDGDSSDQKNPMHIYDEKGAYDVALRVHNSACYTVKFRKYFINAGTDNIKELDPESVKIYPNPTSSFLNIESETQIQILNVYNTLGELIISNSEINQNNIQLDLTQHSKGTYFLEIWDIDNKLLRQIIILE
jgi:PKD repeat protein